MSGPVAAARRDVKLVKDAANLLSTRPNPPNLAEANKVIKNIVRERGNTGKKMLKLGAALILIPDPITGAAGVPILVAGSLLHARQGANVKEVYNELRETIESISKASFH